MNRTQPWSDPFLSLALWWKARRSNILGLCDGPSSCLGMKMLERSKTTIQPHWRKETSSTIVIPDTVNNIREMDLYLLVLCAMVLANVQTVLFCSDLGPPLMCYNRLSTLWEQLVLHAARYLCFMSVCFKNNG